MPFNTRNPIPSGDLRDLDDNARNIDTWANDKTKLSHPDRFGVERRTWHGIEQEAQLNIQQAIDAKNAAQEAAMMSGFSKYADTLAQLEAGIGTDYLEGDVVMVFQDESRGDTSSIFKIESGSAEFKLTFDKTRQDLLSFTGTISADAEWSDVPAHSDPVFDVQAQALANRASYIVDQLERTDTGEFVKGAFVGYKNYTTVESFADAAARDFPVGTLFCLRETTFLVSENPPSSSVYPYIQLANNYAIPIKGHSSKNYGTEKSLGKKTSSALWGTGKSFQGMEVDNRAKTLILSSLTAGTPEVGMLIEYDISSGTIGSEVMRTGSLQTGHCEYFSIVYEGTNRFLWVADGESKTIRKYPFTPGVTFGDEVQSITLPNDIASSTTVNIFNWDAFHAAIWTYFDGAGAVYICKYSDLDSGQFSPVGKISLTNIAGIWAIQPGQNLRAIDGEIFGLSGIQGNGEFTARAAWGNAFGEVYHQQTIDFVSLTPSEVEGLGLLWNESTFKFELLAGVITTVDSGVEVFNLSESNSTPAKERPSNGVFVKEFYAGGDSPLPPARWDGRGVRYKCAGGLAASSFHVGGEGNWYEASDFWIAQTSAKNAAGDNGVAQINYRGLQLRIQGLRSSEDAALGFLSPDGSGGTRWLFNASNKHGIRIGRAPRSYSDSTKRSALEVMPPDTYFEGPVPIGVFSRPSSGQGASFLSSASDLDYAVLAGESMEFGEYNRTSGAVNKWFVATNGAFFSHTDNSRSFGRASERATVVYAATGAINTSDEREKQQWRDQSQAEKAAALEIKSLIKAFKFSDAVNEKGESSRWHFGVGAQTVGDILRNHGLTPESYAFWCYDEWQEQPELKDEEGNIVQEYRAAGNRYGIRYDELSMFILAAM